MQREAGRYEVRTAGGESVRCFVPDPLPPVPPLEMSGEIQLLLERALVAVGRLDSLTTLLPDATLFLYTYVRKEAVLSTQIEGTKSSLSDLLLFELEQAPGVPVDDVVEVSSYVAAMHHGLDRLRGGLPLCNRLLREVHRVLLATGRGSEKEPGEFRRTQNWIGGTRPGNAAFVPPPPEVLGDLMGDLERFMNGETARLPVLIRAGLAHAQFETIHPFLDGNGRIGRLLITLMLCEAGLLSQPMLYLSLFLKQRRDEYYGLLDRVRGHGDWESWLEFFVAGVAETAEGTVATVRWLTAMFDEHRRQIRDLGRAGGSALSVHQTLTERPIQSVQEATVRTGLSNPAAGRAMELLVSLGIVRELTGKRRNRVFGYEAYLAVLAEGTEPL